MSEFHVEVVRVGEIQKHPNADSLSLTMVHGGYPVVFRTGDFEEGDLAVYLPVDSIVPDEERWAFLGGHRRIRAKRLRGVFSMGMLAQVDPAEGWDEGFNVAEAMRITKWEETEEEAPRGPNRPRQPCYDGDEADPGLFPTYTDIEGWRRYKWALADGEEVFITEKIHGENMRAMHDGSRLWVGSRTRIKRPTHASKWWLAAVASDLEQKLQACPGIALYGECHGYTGGFPYGTGKQPTFRVFDAFDTAARRYLDHEQLQALTAMLGLPMVPVLYRGPWSTDLVSLADGASTLDGSHIREGVVIRPVCERFALRLGRVILKMHGEAFLTRKAAA